MQGHLVADWGGRTLTTLRTCAAQLAALAGWRRAVAAFGLGALSVLAMPPLHLWPILWLTLPGLVLLLDGVATEGQRPWRAAATVGWCFGFGYFLPGLYWIGSAFLVEAEKFAWLMPAAVTLMPAGLALFFGAACAAASLWWHPGPTRVLVLTLAIAAAEWLRGHVLTGFPWNVLGYALTAGDAMMQSASVVGVHGLTFLAVLIFASGVLVIDRDLLRLRALPLALALALGLITMLGSLRLPNGSAPLADGVSLRLVQPNTPEKDKFDQSRQLAIFNQLLALSRLGETGDPGSLTGIRIVVWPETPVNVLLLESPEGLGMIADLLPDTTMLVTGALRRESVPPLGLTSGRQQVFNSLVALDGGGRVAALFDKMHLVPFGEFLPLQPVMQALGISELVGIDGGFAAGAGPRHIRLPRLPAFSPLICYEAIFPGAVTAPGERPQWLLNITNDAWFGTTAGPYQHFHQARVRAVEQGLPLVRVAGTGITALVDPYGRVVRSLPLQTAGVIDATLPEALPPTIFARFGDLGLALMMLAAIAVVPIRHRRGY